MDDNEIDIPQEFICPITMLIMKDPVILPDGQTYEREAISQALSINPKSPITRQSINMKQAVTNYALKNLIERFIQGHPSASSQQYNPQNSYQSHPNDPAANHDSYYSEEENEHARLPQNAQQPESEYSYYSEEEPVFTAAPNTRNHPTESDYSAYTDEEPVLASPMSTETENSYCSEDDPALGVVNHLAEIVYDASLLARCQHASPLPTEAESSYYSEDDPVLRSAQDSSSSTAASDYSICTDDESPLVRYQHSSPMPTRQRIHITVTSNLYI